MFLKEMIPTGLRNGASWPKSAQNQEERSRSTQKDFLQTYKRKNIFARFDQNHWKPKGSAAAFTANSKEIKRADELDTGTLVLKVVQ